MKLSEHFTLEELCASETASRHGIANIPSPNALENLKRLAESLELVRLILKAPIHINSGYRSPALNRLVGGAANSAHQFGLAADVICPAYGNPLAVCHAVADHGIDFEQIIYEYASWMHFAIADEGMTPKKELLTIRNAKEGYLKGLIGEG